MAATHIGHCQICGRQHKLPRDRIAKHGYTIRHGWQEGACFGSGAKPYELSCDLLPPAIERAREYVAKTMERIAKLTADARVDVDEFGYLLADVVVNHARVVQPVRLSLNAAGRIEARTVLDEVLPLYYHDARRAKSVDEALRMMADARVTYMRATVREAKDSLEYMQERLDTWMIAPVIALTAEDAAAAAPRVHFPFKLSRWQFTSTACSSSYAAAARNRHRPMTTEIEKVTCSGCRRVALRQGLT